MDCAQVVQVLVRPQVYGAAAVWTLVEVSGVVAISAAAIRARAAN